jgi:hypothetical protein
MFSHYFDRRFFEL